MGAAGSTVQADLARAPGVGGSTTSESLIPERDRELFGEDLVDAFEDAFPELETHVPPAAKEGEELIEYVKSCLALKCPQGEEQSLKADNLRKDIILITGAGCSINMSGGASPTWGQLVERTSQEFVSEVSQAFLDEHVPGDATFQDALATDPTDASDALFNAVKAHILNRGGTRAEATLHMRMLMQRVLARARAVHPELGVALHEWGTFALTTVNYDFILSDACADGQRVPFSFNSIPNDELQQHTNGENNAVPYILKNSVLHVHGLRTDHDRTNGFTLTSAEYNDPQNLLRFLIFFGTMIRPEDSRSQMLVFVGAEGTLVDPHFNALWELLARRPTAGRGSLEDLVHLVLVCGNADQGDHAGGLPHASNRIWTTVAEVHNTYGVVIVPIVYGTAYSELAAYCQNPIVNW